MEAQALAKYIRMSPRKVRYSADLIRGKKVGEALNILEHTPKRGARAIAKVVNSALANARQKKITYAMLYVKQEKWDKYKPKSFRQLVEMFRKIF